MSGTKVIEYLLKKEIFPAELGLRTLLIFQELRESVESHLHYERTLIKSYNLIMMLNLKRKRILATQKIPY
jgi:hypothetical protein